MKQEFEFYIKNHDTEALHEIMTESDDWMLCLDAAEALVMLGDERGFDFLTDATESSDRDIRDVAKEILDSPVVQKMRFTFQAERQEGRRDSLETARKRLQQGKKVYRYKSIYLSASLFTADGMDAGDIDLPVLNDYGMAGWEVAAFFAHQSASSAVLPGTRLAGGYFLLQKEVTPDEIAELDEM